LPTTHGSELPAGNLIIVRGQVRSTAAAC